jgi:hypothetical protein
VVTIDGAAVSQERLSRKLGQVRALLAQAEDPAATPAEAEAYNRKASELIARYGIDAAMLAQTDPSTDAVGDRVIDVEPPYGYDKVGLLNVVALGCRCRVVARARRSGGRKSWSIHLFGFRSDLERVELLYTSLLLQSASRLTSTPVPPGANAGAFRRSWLEGFSVAVQRRLKAAEAAALSAAAKEAASPDPGRSMEVVLVDRGALVDRAVEAEYPRLKQGRRRSLSGSGYGAGHAAGRRAELGADRGSVSRASSRSAVGSR